MQTWVVEKTQALPLLHVKLVTQLPKWLTAPSGEVNCPMKDAWNANHTNK